MSAATGKPSSARFTVPEPWSGHGNNLAFVCHPIHRGGVTRWMADAAIEWQRRTSSCWFVAPLHKPEIRDASARPSVWELLERRLDSAAPHSVQPVVGSEFELGSVSYRAHVYARSIQARVPPGTPIIVSDDAAVWKAAGMLYRRNPMIGVLHADEDWYYRLANRYRDRMSACAAVSHAIAATFAARVGERSRGPSVIPCGIVLPPFAAQPSTGVERHRELRLIWIGRIDERQKRISDLPKIALRLAQHDRDFHLDVIGDGPDAWRITNGLPDFVSSRITLHGWRDADGVNALLSRADVLLLPSNFEGMPVVAMEALAHGCAVVASDTSGLQEYGREPGSNSVWIYPIGNVEAATAAVRAASDSDVRSRRARARAFAEREFSIRVCMDRYTQLLDGLQSRALVPHVAFPSYHWTRVWSAGLAALRRTRLKSI